MSEQPKGRPQWIRETGLVSVTLPEPPLTQKYRGGQTVSAEEEFGRALSDATLESLASAGVTLVFARFYSGFGLEFEKAETERARDLITRAHTHGFKVAAALQLGLVVPETLLLEEHECHNWLQVNADGRHCGAGADAGVAGARPCYNCEGFQRYMERVCALAVDCGADLVHFDNAAYNTEPDTCRCPICVAAFRDFLRQQYGPQDDKTRQAGLARFGHSTFTHVRPPAANAVAPGMLSDPVCSPHEQEWIRFKARTLSTCVGRLSRAIARRNPECAVGADMLRGSTRNESLEGISYPAQLPALDLVRMPATAQSRAEELTAGAATSDGVPNEESAAGCLAADSAARACGVIVADTPCANDVAAGLRLAHAFGVAADMGAAYGASEVLLALNLALNHSGLGSVGTLARLANDGDDAARAYRDFLARHKAELLGAQHLRGLALYCDTPSRMFDAGGFAVRCALEQQLLCAGLPFEPLFSSHIAELPLYRCVVLVNCEFLGDETAQALTRYVEGGGGLVALGAAGSRDEWGRARTTGALHALCGANVSQAQRRQAGAGRVACLPLSEASMPALTEAVAFCAGEAMPWSVAAEGGSVLSQAAQATDGALLLHVVDLSGSAFARGLQCTLACDRKPQQVLVSAPKQDYGPLTFFTWDAKGVQFAAGDEITSGKPRYLLFRVTF